MFSFLDARMMEVINDVGDKKVQCVLQAVPWIARCDKAYNEIGHRCFSDRRRFGFLFFVGCRSCFIHLPCTSILCKKGAKLEHVTFRSAVSLREKGAAGAHLWVDDEGALYISQMPIMLIPWSQLWVELMVKLSLMPTLTITFLYGIFLWLKPLPLCEPSNNEHLQKNC